VDLDKIMGKHLTRAFDPNRVISEMTLNKFLAFLRSTPTSLNVQPWHFYVMSSPESKERLASSLGDMFEPGNRSKVIDASHAIIVTTRADLPDSHLQNVFAQENADVRFPDGEYRDKWQGSVHAFLDWRTYNFKDITHWMEKQTYMTVGLAMMAAAELGIEALPLEGFDPHAVDAEFKIREDGYTTTVLLALGYQDLTQVSDKPISRLSADRIFTHI
jgi:nitroreductase/dihydropteridine reductase